MFLFRFALMSLVNRKSADENIIRPRTGGTILTKAFTFNASPENHVGYNNYPLKYVNYHMEVARGVVSIFQGTHCL